MVARVTHVEKALAYAREVVEGKIPACKWVIAACARQIGDLERFASHPLYEWSPQHANHICGFIERLPHVKGPKANAGELIRLEGWQAFILCTVFGWRRKDTGGRRFRRVYIEVPRGNAKSTLSSGVALYALALDGEQGAEIYSVATKKEQARITYGDSFDMLRKRPELALKTGFQLPKTKYAAAPIHHPASFSKFTALSRDANKMDGLNPHLTIIDELHAHQTRDVFDVIESATTKRQSSLTWCITTAGTDTSGICYEVRGFARRVLERSLEDEAQFGIIYTLDDEDDWTSPASWRKANPNWNVSVQPEEFEALAAKALATVSAQNNFKTKCLNIWTNAAVAWMDMRSWEKCSEPGLQIEDFKDDPCYMGLDLATKTDIASKARIFIRWQRAWSRACEQHAHPGTWGCSDCYPEGGATEPHFYLFCQHFLPEAAVEDGRNSQYKGWEISGYLTSTPGDVIDFAAVRESVLEDLETLNLRACAYDPFHATQLSQELYAQGVQMVEIGATVKNFSEPMKALEALVLERRLHHDGDPVLRWMVSNVVAFRDAKENIYPRKEQNSNKIDGVVASIMSLSRALTEPAPSASAGVRFM